DPFYSHEHILHLCTKFTHLSAFPKLLPSSSGSIVKVLSFITYSLHWTCFPTAWEASDHCLFVSTFMLASEVICNDTYSNKLWSIIAQGVYRKVVVCTGSSL
ncbi:hypothetical protein SCLCIDRAFT_112325, partial [Scleroderma citrinum Foug A]